MMHWVRELRRRSVFRVAAGYLVGAWLVLQVAGVIESAAALPDWIDGVVLLVLLAGLPVILAAAWAFEMGPEGLRRTSPDPTATPARPFAITDLVLIALLLAVVGLVSVQYLTDRPAARSEPAVATADTTDATATATPMITDASIAVLPFADYSPDGDQQYFADGIAEELLNALAQFPDLKVAARTSAFAFRGEEVDLTEVGRALGVAHVLEGSVRRAGDRLRITAQLIRAEDGFHLWSETYERELTDVFAIQDDIVRELSRVLQVRFGVGGGAGRAEGTAVDPRAYDQYLRGLSHWHSRTAGPEARQAAWRALELATELAPDFADAWAAKGVVLASTYPDHLGMDKATIARLTEAALARALELDPDNARAHSGYAVHSLMHAYDPVAALSHSERALALAPNAAFAHFRRGIALITVGDMLAADRAYQRAMLLDPANTIIRYNYALHLGYAGRYQEARDLFAQCCDLGQPDTLVPLTLAAFHAGSEAEAMAMQQALMDWVAVHAPDDLAGAREDFAAVRNVVFSTPTDREAEWTPNRLASALPGLAAFALAKLDRVDEALVALEAVDATRDADFLPFHLHAGRLEFPENLRRHPRYHAIWARPGWADLARLRRENAQTAGLPLPPEGASEASGTP
ncbi:tetratricopeptide repeat protein [Maricaulis sp. CAU 1757]